MFLLNNPFYSEFPLKIHQLWPTPTGSSVSTLTWQSNPIEIFFQRHSKFETHFVHLTSTSVEIHHFPHFKPPKNARNLRVFCENANWLVLSREWGNGMTIIGYYGSFPHSLLSTSKSRPLPPRLELPPRRAAPVGPLPGGSDPAAAGGSALDSRGDGRCWFFTMRNDGLIWFNML